ncbi:MAG: hypothetical protein ACOCZ7_00235 [Armatimonadota bacterium]
MRLLLSATTAVLLTGATVCAQDAEFWQRGHVRELLVNGIEDVSLEEWADAGVNCVMGVEPAKAHALEMKTRTWFTMTAINPTVFDDDVERIRSMAAVGRDGTIKRPYDPLFPSVADLYTACVNNPIWREYSANRFRTMAEDEWDGCHIDYASHYEECYCEHCQQAWREFAQERGLPATDLMNLPDDFATRMHQREFRILSVMDFLGMVRDEARKVRPGFGTDGTWHQDSGSTYQWAYESEGAFGEHFDMMCIEGTTWGPFPPESQQILWLKLAHALSNDEVAMSVTYHLISDEDGRHHGRMAGDRAEVALCEIMSQGAVSWLGLGGPKTGNLLREHSAMVSDVYSTWAALEPELTGRREIGQVGIVFSPRSYLTSGGSRKQLYALGQALMRAHVPFVIHSDVGLTAETLAQCPATVVLDASAMKDEAMDALQQHVASGASVLFAGQMPRYAADWSERETLRELFVRPEDVDAVTSKMVDGREVWYAPIDASAGTSMGAAQQVEINQETPAPLVIEGESKALDVSGAQDSNYSLYVDLIHADGTPLWGQVATFSPGTHDWEHARYVIEPTKPIRSANVHLLFRNHGGTAWFRRVKFGPLDPDTGEITQNLLNDGAWEPYNSGYEVEEIAGEGPTIKTAAGPEVLAVSPMHQPADNTMESTLEFLAPVLPDEPMLRVEGERAEQVFCDVALTDGGALLQLVNYNAQLHPDLPEMEQTEADRSVPVENLRVSFEPPDGRTIRGATLRVPGEAPRAIEIEAGSFVLPTLRAYAAVVMELGPAE